MLRCGVSFGGNVYNYHSINPWFRFIYMRLDASGWIFRVNGSVFAYHTWILWDKHVF